MSRVYSAVIAELSVINIGRKSVEDYLFDVILRFQEGEDTVIIKGFGVFISKAVDVYNRLKERLGESVELMDVEIGSERVGRRIKPFIAIKVKRKY